MDENRTHIKTLAKQYTDAGKPTEWFEVIYAQAKAGKAVVPWADMKANPNLTQWLDKNTVKGQGKTALKVGCGLGDDVEELSKRGFNVIGFDISASAIDWCNSRFPSSTAQYIVADLLHAPSHWSQLFDFVLESYTLQALPSSLCSKAIEQIANFVAPEGQLLVISRGRKAHEDAGNMPYPLTQDEVMQFVNAGLSLVNFEDYLDEESPPVRRFRAEFKRCDVA